MKYGIGLDFGTDSVRAVLVEYDGGEIIASSVSRYRRWQELQFCDPSRSQFRHHPLDYQESLRDVLCRLLDGLDESLKSNIGSIGCAATGSTVCAVDSNWIPLSLHGAFKDNPHAMFMLWKDRSAWKEAQEFNLLSRNWDPDYTMFQGEYSSEWFWAKLIHASRSDERIRVHGWTWIELCDWIPSLLTGRTNYRSQCAAAHKALYNSRYSGLPSREFLMKLDPYAAVIRDRYTSLPSPSDTPVGTISSEWAELLGLPETVVIGGSSLDAHAGAVGAGLKPGSLVSVLGTSGVHLSLLPYGSDPGLLKQLTTYCGLAEDSIIPGYWGVESGQAAFGDVLSWFSGIAAWNREHEVQGRDRVLGRLEQLVSGRMPGLNSLIGIDWFNGRRYPVGSDLVKGALVGLDLSSDVPSIYSALLDSIIFGMKRIISGMMENGVQVEKIIAVGGAAGKSETLMKRLASVLGMPIMVSGQQEACAAGAAMYGASACGKFTDIPHAQQYMCSSDGKYYFPDDNMAAAYEPVYQRYLRTGASLDRMWSGESSLT